MCGNEISAVAGPGDQFRTLIQNQLATRAIKIKQREIGLAQINLLKDINMSNIAVLQLVNCNIRSDTLSAISQLNWQNLCKLNLNNNQIGSQGCKILASAPSFNKLQILQLNNNHIKDQGLVNLISGGFSQQLQDLSVSDNQISKNGISKIANSFVNLFCFSAGGNALADDSIKILAENLNLSKLIYLKLSRNKITDDGLTQLLSSNQLKQLEVLLVEMNNIKKKKKQFKEINGVNKELFLFY